jgi:hypothetical protein
MRYQINIQTSEGSVNVMLRDCGSYKPGNVIDCLVNTSKAFQEQAKNTSAKTIAYDLSEGYDGDIITFSYNVSKNCESVAKNTTSKKYICKYQIALMSVNKTTALIEISKTSTSLRLR